VAQVNAHIDSLTPDEFARAFINASNESRFIMQARLPTYDQERKGEIKRRSDYYSSPEGSARLALDSDS